MRLARPPPGGRGGLPAEHRGRTFGGVRPTRPDQDTAVLIHRQALAVNELVLEGLEVLVIELEVQLEGPIGQASTPLGSMAIAWSSTPQRSWPSLPVSWGSRIASSGSHLTTLAQSI